MQSNLTPLQIGSRWIEVTNEVASWCMWYMWRYKFSSWEYCWQMGKERDAWCVCNTIYVHLKAACAYWIGAGVCAVQRSEPWGLAAGGVWWHPQAPGEAEEQGGDPARPRWGTNTTALTAVCGEDTASRHYPQVSAGLVAFLCLLASLTYRQR